MTSRFALSQFDFPLDEAQLARHPARPRDSARLLVVTQKKRGKPQLIDQHIHNLPQWFRRGDVLVINTTKVFPARLLGRRPTGGKVEVLLLHKKKGGDWICVGKGLSELGELRFSSRLTALVVKHCVDDTWQVRFSLKSTALWKEINQIGHTPLPPYLKNISESKKIRHSYQTIFAHQIGSAAAPTAGLHFTPQLLTRLRQAGVIIVPVLLHVGWGTFSPIRHSDIRQHSMHAEWGEISTANRKKLLLAKKSKTRIFAVGTTALRVVEAAALDNKHKTGKWSGWIQLYLKPGDKLKMVNGLLTNFHLPKTTLFVLACTILGTQQAQEIYANARERGYRWASFGDAMLILPKNHSRIVRSTPV